MVLVSTLLALPLRAQTLVILGDSLSASYGMATHEGWVARLEERLAEEAPRVKVVNASVSGATTTAGLQRLPSLLQEHKPRWVLLELGANDGLQGNPLSMISANLERVIDLSQAAGAQVVLFGMQLPPNLGRRYTEPFADMFVGLAQQYDLTYVPFLLDGVAGQKDLMMNDGLHPNAQASERIFANVWSVLGPTIRADSGVKRKSVAPK